MDTITPEDISFLNFLSDKNPGLLLHNGQEMSEIPSTSALPPESIFTEYVDANSAWTVDGVPVYLNGPTLTEVGDQAGHLGLLETDDHSKVDSLQPEDYPLDIPDKGFLTSSGLFFPNEVLLQLNLQSEPVPEEPIKQNSLDILSQHIFKKNEPVLTITKRANDVKQGQLNEITVNESIDDFIEIISVHKCKHCSALFERYEDIVTHLQKLCFKRAEKDRVGFGFQPKVQKMSSLLMTDENKKPLVKDIYLCGMCEHVGCETLEDLKEHMLTRHNMTYNEELERKPTQPEPENQNGSNGEFQTIVSKQAAQKKIKYEDIVTHLQKLCFKRAEKDRVGFGFQPKVQKMSSLLMTDENKKPLVKDIYLCGMCEHVGCETLEDLKEHMLTRHNMTYNEELERKPTQPEPENQNGSNGEFQTIVSKQAAQKKIKCLLKGCDSRFARAELMMRHHECHVEGEPKKFKCPECDKIFFMWRVCSSHLWKCHKIDIGLYNCTVCNSFKCLSARNLLVHMSIHDTTKPFKPFLCSICGADFKEMAHLKNHESVHKDIEMLKWETSVKCTTCNQAFSSTKSLKKHVQSVHNKFKPFICNICGHKCARKSMLELHFRQHTGEKPFKCKICDYKTGDPNSLRRHSNRHYGVTNYSCPHCSYTTIQSIAYKSHIKKKHPGKTGFYSCLVCSFDTVNEKLYSDHLKEHSVGLTNGGPIKIEVLNEHVIPSSSSNIKTIPNLEDEETQPGFFSDHLDDMTIDTGGITIPAGLEMQV